METDGLGPGIQKIAYPLDSKRFLSRGDGDFKYNFKERENIAKKELDAQKARVPELVTDPKSMHKTPEQLAKEIPLHEWFSAKYMAPNPFAKFEGHVVKDDKDGTEWKVYHAGVSIPSESFDFVLSSDLCCPEYCFLMVKPDATEELIQSTLDFYANPENTRYMYRTQMGKYGTFNKSQLSKLKPKYIHNQDGYNRKIVGKGKGRIVPCEPTPLFLDRKQALLLEPRESLFIGGINFQMSDSANAILDNVPILGEAGAGAVMASAEQQQKSSAGPVSAEAKKNKGGKKKKKGGEESSSGDEDDSKTHEINSESSESESDSESDSDSSSSSDDKKDAKKKAGKGGKKAAKGGKKEKGGKKDKKKKEKPKKKGKKQKKPSSSSESESSSEDEGNKKKKSKKEVVASKVPNGKAMPATPKKEEEKLVTPRKEEPSTPKPAQEDEFDIETVLRSPPEPKTPAKAASKTPKGASKEKEKGKEKESKEKESKKRKKEDESSSDEESDKESAPKPKKKSGSKKGKVMWPKAERDQWANDTMMRAAEKLSGDIVAGTRQFESVTKPSKDCDWPVSKQIENFLVWDTFYAPKTKPYKDEMQDPLEKVPKPEDWEKLGYKLPPEIMQGFRQYGRFKYEFLGQMSGWPHHETPKPDVKKKKPVFEI